MNGWQPVYRPAWSVLLLILAGYLVVAAIVAQVVPRKPHAGNKLIEAEK